MVDDLLYFHRWMSSSRAIISLYIILFGLDLKRIQVAVSRLFGFGCKLLVTES